MGYSMPAALEREWVFWSWARGAPPSLTRAETTLPSGEKLDFELLSLPLYLVCQVRRLAERMLLP